MQYNLELPQSLLIRAVIQCLSGLRPPEKRTYIDIDEATGIQLRTCPYVV